MKLIIVESPHKAKTIQKYLGTGYRVTASKGHICDLPPRELGIDVEHNFVPKYIETPEQKDTVKRLIEMVKSADQVYLATDPDREGEAISWHLKNFLGIGDGEIRIEFNEISGKAVNRALENPREINMRLVDAQQARRVLDRLVGYKVSPILSRKIKSGLSGGRVQSATLKMIVDREKEITSFVPVEYWTLTALFNDGSRDAVTIKSTLADKNKVNLKIENEETMNAVLSDLKTAKYKVDSVKKSVARVRPFPPFTTSTLQQDGSHRLGMSAPQVMQIAQQLYEGVEVAGEGQIALVTYIRTDSVRVSPDFQADTLKYIRAYFGDEYAPYRPNFFTSKGAIQDAHEAIRPISLDITPDSIKDKVQRNQYRLYKLVYERYLSSQMTDAVYDTLTVRVAASCQNDEYGFKISGKTIKFKGYTVIYDNSFVDEDEKDENALPSLTEGEILFLTKLKSEKKFTKPPLRFTDASLVKAMEENGIGRPSTYSSVISVLSKREYTEKDQKSIKPTALGMQVVEFLENCFSDIIDLKFTANMEKSLDTVEEGVEWQNIIKDFYPKFIEEIKMAENNTTKIQQPNEVTDVICDKCGANMVIKEGRYGKFLACPNYPKCKNIKSLPPVKVSTCPKCGGDVNEKHSKTGKIFYGCSNYPNCDFSAWEIPAPVLCPECKGAMRIVKKKTGTQYVCMNKACGHTEDAKNEK